MKIMQKITVFIFILFFGCENHEEEYVKITTKVALNQPSNFPKLRYNLIQNPLTEEGIALGKKLFYEGRLSKNSVVSCGFCHEQASAFTHHGHTISHGVNNLLGFRNAQPIQNLAYFEEFNWDGSAIHLDLQPIIPITSEFEMGETIPSVLDKLSLDTDYKQLFEDAFGDDEINSERMLKALSQFMVTMISSNSKYDKIVRNEGNIYFTDEEKEGFKLFKNKCASCHSGELFTDKSYRNNGLPFNSKFPDEEGRARVTGFLDDFYKFRVPSLRNVAVTFPYMHDGRFKTLNAVLNFYSEGMLDNGGKIDTLLLKRDGSFGINLTPSEKKYLIKFLNTLTDNTFLNDKRFSEF
ncbi:cytochrome-c peroxidase [Polaribacter tangerinus]|uniref:cytochrome-c peroxidase n=1 Tax=Polaribacter tangerinus TaxID=1920034 RepID=UPI001E29A236|nr:cytochrome c peroxidase [Polaribacter tangerinus]